MSQPFSARILVTGSRATTGQVRDFLRNEWNEMKVDNTVLQGFRWVQREAPKEVTLASNEATETLAFDFDADGGGPERYAVVLSLKFPDARFALLAADASDMEWLAKAIATRRGAYVFVQFERGKEGCPRGYDDNKLLKFLESKLPAMHRRIGDDGKLVSADESSPAKWLDEGVITLEPSTA